MAESGLIVFDADDTLWESSMFFLRAAEDFVRLMTGLGLDEETVTELVHRRDIERLSVTGYGAEPYIDTLKHVLAELCSTVPKAARVAFDGIGRALLEHPVLPYPGVVDTLDALAARGHPLVVWTMGRPGHQGDKLDRCGFRDRFERSFIVSHKTPANLRQAIEAMGSTPEQATMVGNSPRSDINSALSIGARAIWIPDDNLWVAERQPFERPEAVTRLERFSDLLGVV